MEVQEWLDALEEKIRELDIPAQEEIEQIEKTIASLEKLEEMLSQIESVLKRKSALNEKMERLIARINRLTQPEEEKRVAKKAPPPVLEDTLMKIAGRAKLASRALDALATNLQLSLESAGRLRAKDIQEEGEKDPGDKRENKRDSKEQIDLQAILQPLGTLVQNIVEEKLKRIQQGTKT